MSHSAVIAVLFTYRYALDWTSLYAIPPQVLILPTWQQAANTVSQAIYPPAGDVGLASRQLPGFF